MLSSDSTWWLDGVKKVCSAMSLELSDAKVGVLAHSALEGICEWDKWRCDCIRCNREYLRRRAVKEWTAMKWQFLLHWHPGGPGSMPDCVELSYGGFADRTITTAPRHLNNLFQRVPACVLKEFQCCISLFFLSGYILRWGKSFAEMNKDVSSLPKIHMYTQFHFTY